MNLKNLNKATKIYEKIKALDAEINQIEKLANLILNKETKASFSLNIEATEKEEKKVTLDEDGFLQYPHSEDKAAQYIQRMRGGFSFCDMILPPPSSCSNTKDTHSLSQEFSTSGSLRILSILIYEKKIEREELLQNLEKLGIK